MDLSDLPEAAMNRFAEFLRATPRIDGDLPAWAIEKLGFTADVIEHHATDALAKLQYVAEGEKGPGSTGWCDEAITMVARALVLVAICERLFVALTGSRPSWTLQIEVDRLLPSRN